MRSRTVIFYSLPAMVIAIPTLPIYVILPQLYGSELGLGLSVTGLVLLVARLFDTVTDPIIGLASDNFGIKGNKRKPWIGAGALISGVGLYMLLVPNDGVGALYLLGWSIFLYCGWTMVAVPYLAWGAELSSIYTERTRITAWREALSLVGFIGAGGVIAVSASSGLENREAIKVLVIGAFVIGVPAFLGLLMVVKEKSSEKFEENFSGFKISDVWKSLKQNRVFIRLLMAWFFNGLANGIPAALFFLFLEFRLGATETEKAVLILVYFVSAVLFIPVWRKLSDQYGKHKMWSWAMLIASGVFILVPLIPDGALVFFGIICVITGAALGADLILPPALQADVVGYGKFKFGKSHAGLLFSFWGLSTKFALALAVGLALPGVEYAGFNPKSVTPEGVFALALIYAVVPAVLKLVAVTLVWNFPLTAKKVQVVELAIARRECLRTTE